LVFTLRRLALAATFTRFLADLIIGMSHYYTGITPVCKVNSIDYL
jgi:hypothetical protein